MGLFSHCNYGIQFSLHVFSNIYTHGLVLFLQRSLTNKSCQKEENFGEPHAGYEILKPKETPMRPARTLFVQR